MLKRVCVILHVKVFFLLACSGLLIPCPIGKRLHRKWEAQGGSLIER